jgi:hypothetical protein
VQLQLRRKWPKTAGDLALSSSADIGRTQLEFYPQPH